jgi:hypothetical protein
MNFSHGTTTQTFLNGAHRQLTFEGVLRAKIVYILIKAVIKKLAQKATPLPS